MSINIKEPQVVDEWFICGLDNIGTSNKNIKYIEVEGRLWVKLERY